ncbi:hypothetical protein BDZ94DRAFT_1247646 [Collybia nuda]|uniref:DUF6593 domain-containing protein n=1 Tax=Collybia nuda TaxID=64659 RepID=A0A9P6CMY6_9AGAR|nr:hypothetical protein BDZ94DRAFT_1247646 [Collybia nuda]
MQFNTGVSTSGLMPRIKTAAWPPTRSDHFTLAHNAHSDKAVPTGLIFKRDHSQNLPTTNHQSIFRATKMHLYLSNASPINSIYANADGQALYKVRTPSRLFGRTTAICSIIEGGVPARTEQDIYQNGATQDRFGQLAKFEWKSFRSSKIRFTSRGREVKTRSFFKKQGMGWHGRSRAFVAPDGREYRWRLSANPELHLNDETKAPVARFHSGRSGAFCKPQSACLEILPAGEHIIDTILVTFIYVEKLREDE